MNPPSITTATVTSFVTVIVKSRQIHTMQVTLICSLQMKKAGSRRLRRLWSATTFGKVHVRTYWKYYDRQQGFSKKVLNDSVRESPTDWPIAKYSLEQIPKTFNHDSLQDLGNGQMMVTLFGRFLEGTYIRIGNSFLRDGNPAFLSEYRQIRFVASIADLATKQVAIVARDGTEHILAFSSDPFGCALTKHAVAFTAVDDTNTQVSLTFDGTLPDQDNFPLTMVIAGKSYGYSDAPIQRVGKVLSVVVPTATLLANPTITTSSGYKDAIESIALMMIDSCHFSHTEVTRCWRLLVTAGWETKKRQPVRRRVAIKLINVSMGIRRTRHNAWQRITSMWQVIINRND